MPGRSRRRTWLGSGSAAQARPGGGDEAIQHEGGLARPGRTGHRGQAVHRKLSGEVVQVVEVGDLDGDLRVVSCTLGSVAGNAGRAGQERADDRARVGFQLTGGARGDHVAALRAGWRGRVR